MRTSCSLLGVFSRVKSVLTSRRFLALFVLVFLGVVVATTAVYAQSQGAPNSPLRRGVAILQEPLGLPAVDIRIIIARIIRVALELLGLVLLIIVLYAGFIWMTAGGNEEKIGQAKKMIVNATIGLAIILSAFSIVTYILHLLGVRSGDGGGVGIGAPGEQQFQGSGALGSIIKDHYPMRGQTGVPRNTKIIITFRRPIKLDNIVTDTNGSGTLGDCVNIGQNMKWEQDCDRVKTLDNDYIIINRVDTGEIVRGANLLAAYENGKVFTIVLRPFDPLGSDTAPTPYRVRLGKEIKLDDPANSNPSAFQSSVVGNSYYDWQFTCSTELDRRPPTVASVYPYAGTSAFKNSVIQIDFSEAMDPIGLQGTVTTTDDNNNSFVIAGGSVYLKSAKSQQPVGTFRLTNGYRTLEFRSTLECGTNACGGKLYCLPVCDNPGANCPADPFKQDGYEVLVKAAQVLSKQSFEGIPFSGAMDVAGNALDGSADGAVQIAGGAPPVFPNWKQPDNYFWGFNVKDQIDNTSPIINRVAPGLDATFVSTDALWHMVFSKRMQADSFYTIRLEEKPTPAERGDNIPTCLMPRAWFMFDGTTRAVMEHCPFLSKRQQYYYPVATSDVEDVNYNCFYPGKGPGDLGDGQGGKAGGNAFWTKQGGLRLSESLQCDSGSKDCCAVSTSTPNLALCCNGLAGIKDATTPAGCLTELKKDSL